MPDVALLALLYRSSGTVPAQEVTSIAYARDAIIPLEPSTKLSTAEMASVAGGSATGSVVRIFCIDAPVVAQIQSICAAGPRRISTDLRHQVPLVHRRALLDALASGLQLPQALTERGIHWQHGGLPTVTYDPDSMAFLGLHVDDFERRPLPLRHASHQRISINLGPGFRFFLYLDLTLQKIGDLLRESNLWENSNPHALAQKFMTSFPTYPVMRVLLPPGHGYMAPTENLIHDGSTLHESGDSFLFTACSQQRKHLE